MSNFFNKSGVRFDDFEKAADRYVGPEKPAQV